MGWNSASLRVLIHWGPSPVPGRGGRALEEVLEGASPWVLYSFTGVLEAPKLPQDLSGGCHWPAACLSDHPKAGSAAAPSHL